MKIPQLAVRDTTGAEIPGYFNIWRWILPQLTPAERGGKKGSPEAGSDPEVGEHADRDARRAVGGAASGVGRSDGRSAAARVHPRLQEHGDREGGLRVAGARTSRRWASRRRRSKGSCNADGRVNTIRVDSKVVRETDTGHAKSDESQWMRFTLDTVGQDGVAARSAGPADLSGGIRGAGGEARAAAASARDATSAASSPSAC